MIQDVSRWRLSPKGDGQQALVVRIPDELHAWVRCEAQQRGVPQRMIVEEALVKLREAG
jgi:formate-dependent phosphoribosylglycinamide formyltransferase (GAR transformylase)